MRRRAYGLLLPALMSCAVVTACLEDVPFEGADGTGGLGLAGAGVGGSEAAGGGSGGEWTAGSGAHTSAGNEDEAIVVANSVIVGIHVTDTHIYWLTHGSLTNSPDHPNIAGTIARMGVNGGPVEVQVTGLDRPVRFGMTSAAAYIWLQESWTLAYVGFQEAPLGTTYPYSVEVGGSAPVHFFPFEERAYVSHDLGETSGVFEHVVGADARQVIWGMPTDLAADSTHVYFALEDGTLFRAPLDDPTATEELATGVIRGFDLWQGQVLVLGEGALLAMPQEGGALVEVVTLPAGGPYADLRVAGDRYYVAELTGNGGHNLYTGLAPSGDAAWFFAVRPDSQVWFGTETAVYVAVDTILQRITFD